MANHFKVGLEELEVDGYFTIDKHNLLYRYQVSYNHQNLTTIYCSAKMDLKGYLNVENNYYKY